ncbi:MAG TPA: hypothetical protein PLP33_25975 [Leptospiraceae bacterium]|nr:hypothetical protein [Leptospiraceae bacterium]
MSLEKELIIEKLNESSLRELDVLVARYFYNYEVKIDRVDSKNNNNIKYLYLSKRKRKYTRHFSKSKTVSEKVNDSWRPLPRWSSDIRDCKKLINDSVAEAGKIAITILDRNNSEVIVRGNKFSGNLCSCIVKGIILHAIMEKEK